MKILISGYYGFGNTGDEAVLQSIILGVRERFPEAHITVMSKTPKLTSEFYKVSAVYRYCSLCPTRQLLKSDVFVSGGGTLFQNSTSNLSLIYYLSWILWAKLLRRKVMVFAQGFGPLKGKFARWLTRFVLKRVDCITLRDPDSYHLVKELVGSEFDKIHLTADPTLILEPASIEKGKKLLSLEGVKNDGKPLLGIALRDSKLFNTESFIKALIDNVNWLCEQKGYVPVFLLFQSPQDMHVTSKVMAEIKSETHLVFRICQPNEMLALFLNFDLFIGMRLHSLIFALINAVPMLGISYDPKVASFMKEIDQPCVNFANMAEITKKVLENKASIKQSLLEHRNRLKKNADKSFEILGTLV